MRRLSLAVIVLLLLWSVLEGKVDKYWIFFSDKGKIDIDSALAHLEANLTPHARARREKLFSNREFLVDFQDIPVNEDYIRSLQLMGVVPVHRSRWLNAISAYLPDTLLEDIQMFGFVDSVKRIIPLPADNGKPMTVPLFSPGETLPYDYGPSFHQYDMIKIPFAHRLGLTGDGVLVCIMDTGFRTTHQAFAEMEIVATYDFIDGDEVVDLEPGDLPSQIYHGTSTLSVVGGRYDGQIVAPAFGSWYLLAKTEDLSMEMPVEMDHWVAAMEWADSIGADVITTSLGYSRFDDGTGYTYEDMDGNTTVITVAADRAAELGILVFTSAGNSGPSPGTLTAPADADSAVAVGALEPYGEPAGFSSRGPTYDRRIKPDISTQGVAVACANSEDDFSFGAFGGTSAACPIAAGLGALLLEAHPDWTPTMAIDSVKRYASESATPNNDVGWGIPNLLLTLTGGVDTLTVPISLVRGWNMISFPIIFESDIRDVLPIIGYAYSFDPESYAYRRDSIATPGVGYFVLSGVDTTVYITGVPVPIYARELHAGWNLVGSICRDFAYPSVDSRPDGVLYGGAYLFNAGSRRYEERDTLEPGKGYWILSLEPSKIWVGR